MRRVLSVLVLASSTLAAGSLAETMAHMDKASAGFAGLTADVKQTAHTAVVNDDTIDSGQLKLKREKRNETRILMEFTNPNPKIVAINGDEFRMYIPKANVVQVYDLHSHRNAVNQGLLLGFGATSAEINAAYDASWVGDETINGQATGHIKLLPKSEDVRRQIRQADLWISNATGTPVQQKLLTSNTGDFTQLVYSNVKINPSLSDKDLRLNAPKTAQIQQVGK